MLQCHCERPKGGSTARSGRSGRYAHANHDSFFVILLVQSGSVGRLSKDELVEGATSLGSSL